MRSGASELVRELVEALRERVGGERVEDVRIGLFYTGVKLSTGHGGVAFTPRRWTTEATCCPDMEGKMPGAGDLKGMSVEDALELALSPHPLLRAVGIATINAASAPILFEEQRYKIEYDADPVNPEEIQLDEKVVMVGAFKPYVNPLRKRVKELKIYDDNLQLLRELGLPEDPGKPLQEALKEADIVILTGSALVVSGMDEILDNARSAKKLIIVGPTSSMLPDPFFSRGATALAGIRITNPDRMLQVISEAGGTRAILRNAARKFVAWRG